MRMADLDNYLLIPALGRTEDLGYLYDARTESIQESIFMGPVDLSEHSKFISSTNTPSSCTDIYRSSTYTEKVKLFDLKGDVKASVFFGLLSVTGSAIYLTEEKSSGSQSEVAVVIRTYTDTEILNICYDGLKDLYDRSTLNRTSATHIVTGIKWGANVILSFTDTLENSQRIDNIHGTVKAAFEKLEDNSGASHLHRKQADDILNAEFSMKLYGDIQLPTIFAQSVQEARELIKQIPALITKSNGGKGIQLEYIMTPIGCIRKHLLLDLTKNSFVSPCGESVLQEVIGYFDELSSVEQKLVSLAADFNLHLYCISETWVIRLKDIQREFCTRMNTLRDELRATLVQVRSGQSQPQALLTLLNNYKRGANEYNVNNVESKLKEFSEVNTKIDFYKMLKTSYPKIEITGRSRSVQNIVFDRANNDMVVYILYIKSEFEAQDPSSWISHIGFFLCTLYQEPKAKLIVVDLDVNDSGSIHISGTVIKQRIRGQVTSEDVCAAVKNETPWKPIKAIKPLSSYSYFEERDKLVKDLHWIKELITNQLDPELKTEATKLGTWLDCLGEAETIFDKRGTFKPLKRQEAELEKLMDDERLFPFAEMLYGKAKYTEALGLFDKIYNRRIVCPGPNDATTINAQHQVARCMDSLNENSKALHLYRFVFEAFNQKLGQLHGNTLAAQHNIAWMFHKEEKYAEALKIYNEVLKKQVSALGKDDPDMLITKANIAECEDKINKLGLNETQTKAK